MLLYMYTIYIMVRGFMLTGMDIRHALDFQSDLVLKRASG
jgi:hypothetical protein